MRRTKHTFTYSNIIVTDLKTKAVLSDTKVEGKTTIDKVASNYIKANGYKPNLDFKIVEEERIFTMSAEDYMKYGTEILPEKTEDDAETTPVEGENK